MQIPDERAKQIIDLLDEVLDWIPPTMGDARTRIASQQQYLKEKLLPAHAY